MWLGFGVVIILVLTVAISGARVISSIEESSNNITNEQTNVMSNDLNHLEEIGCKLTEGVTEVASIAEESDAGVQQTTASAEHSTHQVDAMRAGVAELSNLAGELETFVWLFAIE